MLVDLPLDLDRLLGTWYEVARLPSLESDGFRQRSVDVTVTPADVEVPPEIARDAIEVVDEGRMEVAVRPVVQGAWVVSLGQNLLGGEEARARVRPVSWQRVVRLQGLQREDLMRELNKSKNTAVQREDH